VGETRFVELIEFTRHRPQAAHGEFTARRCGPRDTTEHFQEKWNPVFRSKMRSMQESWSKFGFLKTECAPVVTPSILGYKRLLASGAVGARRKPMVGGL
jgi:hypothetical protein